jgi:FkbM family methyltransferase
VRGTPLPGGPAPALPEGAVELDTLHGTFWLDATDEKLTPWIRSHATWEADVVRLLERTLRPGMVVVDVGANVGLHAVLAAQLVAPGGTVYAVEPQAWTAKLLSANAWRHGCGNLVVLPVAAGERSGTAALAVPPEGRSGAGLVPSGGDGAEVAVEPLDDLVPERVALLKIDVEGAETAVLAGARALISRSPGLVAVVEFRPRASEAAEVLGYYESLGFELCRLGRDGRPRPAASRELLGVEEDVVNIVLRR